MRPLWRIQRLQIHFKPQAWQNTAEQPAALSRLTLTKAVLMVFFAGMLETWVGNRQLNSAEELLRCCAAHLLTLPTL